MSAASAGLVHDAVIELRQYTLHPDRRDTLIGLFEQHFIEPQDAVGAHVVGTFRDLDDPERFVWLRGFDSMPARHAALTAFYDGRLWKSRRDDAVATMRDSDNVLLLRPLQGRTFVAATTGDGLVLALAFDVRHVDPDAFAALFCRTGLAMLEADGATCATVLVTESASNTFTRLPVRVDERVLVCMSRFPDAASLDRCTVRWRGANALRDTAPDALLPAFMRRTEVLRLAPTIASPMR